jgi:hypothetical protein
MNYHKRFMRDVSLLSTRRKNMKFLYERLKPKAKKKQAKRREDEKKKGKQ